MLTQEQRAKLKSAGYSDTKINVFEAQKAIKQKEIENQEPTFAGKVIRETIRPLANVATNVVKAGDVITGGDGSVEPFSGEYLGEVKGLGQIDVTKGFTPENIKVLKDSIKAGVDIGVLLGGGAGTGSVAKTGIKEGIKQGVIQGAKTGSIVGGISGAGTGLEEDATVGSTLANTAIGAGSGALIGGAVGGVTGALPTSQTISKATGEVGKGLKKAGEKAYEVTVTPTERTAQMVRKFEATGKGVKPTTEANTAARLGIAGTEKGLGVKATKASNKLWEETITPALKKNKKTTNMPTFFSELEKEISKSSVGTRKVDLIEALSKMKEDYAGVGDVSNLTLQKFKSDDWAKFIPETSYKGKAIGSAFKEVQSLAQNKAIGILHKNVGKKASQAYIDYGNLQSIIKSADKSAIGDPALKSAGRNLWQMVMDKAVTPIGTYSGKVLYRTGEGLEFMGQKGAKKVGDIVGIATNQAKSGLLKQSQKGLQTPKLKN